ncbi:indole-3-glycerol phosphate synthase TrpC, partial [SAR202 cluster bacterium AD-804-J14_MRT_500m]|nr:indole-3-glycerol phosphate synthase TrpC [SAR202 cluster bacterium AD-804-J14_MRT_500m]
QPTIKLASAFLEDGVCLIAEIKKASPSRGLLMPNFDPAMLSDIYVENGARALSVLTDRRFQGELKHLEIVKMTTSNRFIPVLRKDFIFDPYQIYEARAGGADAILLIAAILSVNQISDLLDLCGKVGLQALVEVHDKAEVEVAIAGGAEFIGINNRDLRTFETDLSVTERLAHLVPEEKMLVSESGIFTADDIIRLYNAKVNAVLVGEALVTAPDVGAKVRELAEAVSVPTRRND